MGFPCFDLFESRSLFSLLGFKGKLSLLETCFFSKLKQWRLVKPPVGWFSSGRSNSFPVELARRSNWAGQIRSCTPTSSALLVPARRDVPVTICQSKCFFFRSGPRYNAYVAYTSQPPLSFRSFESSGFEITFHTRNPVLRMCRWIAYTMWVWVKIKLPAEGRFESLVPFARLLFWVPIFDPRPCV